MCKIIDRRDMEKIYFHIARTIVNKKKKNIVTEKRARCNTIISVHNFFIRKRKHESYTRVCLKIFNSVRFIELSIERAKIISHNRLFHIYLSSHGKSIPDISILSHRIDREIIF